MTKKHQMRLAPPVTRRAEDFVAAAGDVKRDAIIQEKAAPHPWELPGVREDVIKSVNLRLPEPYIIKLQYLSDTTHKSQQIIIREVLLPALDAYIERLAEKG
jgi:hypothetical protein